MPTNLYGPNDNYDLENAHVLPSLLRKFHEAKEQNLPDVNIWGTGKPKREFLYSNDAGAACVFLMQHYNDAKSIINIGCGQDVTIRELAEKIKKVVGYDGNLIFDTSKPDGTMRKQLDVEKINDLGWKFKTSLDDGLKLAYADYLNNKAK